MLGNKIRMRGRLTLKQDFLAKKFSLSPLSTVEYYSGYLLFISHSTICEYACVNTRKTRTSIPEKLHQKRDEHIASFQSTPKINRMLITRLICIQRKFTTPDQLASPSKFCLLRFFFFFSTTKVITFRKISISLILCKLSMYNFRHAATLAYLQVLRTLLGTLETVIPLLARTHEKKNEKKRLHLESRS